MEKVKSNLLEEWLKFLKNFSSEGFEFNSVKSENGWIRFSMNNIFNSEIDLSNNYGFLTLNYKDRSIAEPLLSYSGINRLIKKNSEIELVETSWSTDNFPCRVFISDNKLKICFYDKTEISNSTELLRNRITAFENVMIAVLKLKIKRSVNNS